MLIRCGKRSSWDELVKRSDQEQRPEGGISALKCCRGSDKMACGSNPAVRMGGPGRSKR